ncbi:MAG: trxC [Bacteroidota bacterium]|nr:trxC [Bacteroidota bacterium]
MIKTAVILFSSLILFSGAKVGVVNMAQLHHRVNVSTDFIKDSKIGLSDKTNDTLYVVNFWATWCKPCVGEMPFFIKADERFRSQKVKVVFVSLNSVKEISQVDKFVAEKQVKQEVLLLNAGNPNVWIDQVDSSWSGAIPATVMYRKGQKTFFKEGEFTQNELDSIIKTKIN